MNLTPEEKSQVQSATENVEGWLSLNEAFLLYELAKEGIGNGEIVEIGSYKGKSTIALGLGSIHAKRKEKIWAIDPHEGVIKKGKGSTHGKTFTDFKRNITQAGVYKEVKPVVSSSKNAASHWNKQIRLLFLDGLHDYEHTEEDYRLWKRFVKEGIIAFHDGFCGEEGVEKVIRNHVLNNSKIIDIGTVTSIFYIVLGVPTIITRARVFFKKQVFFSATFLHRLPLPWLIKRIGIHGLLRVFLLNHYTKAIY